MKLTGKPIHDALIVLQQIPPEVTTRAQVEDFLKRMVAAQDANILHATCKHCGKPIQTRLDDKWVHEDDSRSRGCYAATFTQADGWDTSIDRRYMATPMAR